MNYLLKHISYTRKPRDSLAGHVQDRNMVWLNGQHKRRAAEERRAIAGSMWAAIGVRAG